MGAFCLQNLPLCAILTASKSPLAAGEGYHMFRLPITIVLVALQVLWLLWAFWSFTAGRVWLNGALKALSIMIVR